MSWHLARIGPAREIHRSSGPDSRSRVTRRGWPGGAGWSDDRASGRAVSGGSKARKCASSARGGRTGSISRCRRSCTRQRGQFRRGPGDRPVGGRQRHRDPVPGREGMGDVVQLDHRLVDLRPAPAPSACSWLSRWVRFSSPTVTRVERAVRRHVVQPHRDQRLRLVAGEAQMQLAARRGSPAASVSGSDRKTSEPPSSSR